MAAYGVPFNALRAYVADGMSSLLRIGAWHAVEYGAYQESLQDLRVGYDIAEPLLQRSFDLGKERQQIVERIRNEHMLRFREQGFSGWAAGLVAGGQKVVEHTQQIGKEYAGLKQTARLEQGSVKLRDLDAAHLLGQKEAERVGRSKRRFLRHLPQERLSLREGVDWIEHGVLPEHLRGR